ncbi:MAG: hypothetical protein LC804_03320 [Acidobacteria bacterium]|nr:hypothetical protein [Acidobacteriota bacterium]
MKVELQLSLPLGEHPPQDRLDRCAALELGGDLFDRQQIGERIKPLGARVADLADEPPLLQITQMVVRDGGVQAAEIAEAISPAIG